MNTYGIDLRVWKEVVGRKKTVGPALVALAASACPSVLNKGLPRKSEQRIAWTTYDSLHSTEQSDLAIECHGDNARVVVRNALVEWAMSHDDAQTPLRALAEWDRKLGAWCACAVAETALMHAPAGENRPRVAIETTRSWVMGRATIDDVRKAGDAAYTAYAYTAYAYTAAYTAAAAYAASAAYAYTAAYAAYSASSAAYAAYSASAAAAYAAYAASNATYATSEWERIRNAELKRLCEVVAGAIINYPTGEMVDASRGLSRNTLAAGAAGMLIGAGIMRAARKL